MSGNGEEGSKMVEWTSMMMMIAAVITATRVEELILYNRIITWEVIETTRMGKWSWLCVNGCECKGLIAIAVEFSKSYQSATNASLCLQIFLNNIDASAELTGEISHFNHP
jgi:hypothetical protein